MAAKYEEDQCRINSAMTSAGGAFSPISNDGILVHSGSQGLFNYNFGAGAVNQPTAAGSSSNSPGRSVKDIKCSPTRAVGSSAQHPTKPPKGNIAEAMREIHSAQETTRANQAEAALDVALAENRKLGSMVYALDDFLRSLGYSVEDVCDGMGMVLKTS